MVAMEAQALIDALKQLDDTTAVLVITQVLQDRPELAPPVVTFAVPDLTYPPTKLLTERRCKGTMKNYDNQKGCGFIDCEELAPIFGGDVFLHSSQCVVDYPIGTKVSFAVVLSKDNKPQAFDVVKDGLSAPPPQGLPGMPGMGTMQGMPNMGAMQGAMQGTLHGAMQGAMQAQGMQMQTMPGMSAMPGMGAMQGVTGMSGMAGMLGSQPPPPAMGGQGGVQAMGAMGGMQGMPAMGNMLQMMKMGETAGGAASTLGRFNGAIRSFDPMKGCGFVGCNDLQAQGYTNDAILNHQELGAFDVGAQVSFTAFLNAQGQLQAKDLQPQQA